jgi:hypothetical protein
MTHCFAFYAIVQLIYNAFEEFLLKSCKDLRIPYNFSHFPEGIAISLQVL